MISTEQHVLEPSKKKKRFEWSAFSTHQQSVGESTIIHTDSNIWHSVWFVCLLLYSLRMFAVFSVVISISGSVKYSDATHLPFSDPEVKHKHRKQNGASAVVLTCDDHVHGSFSFSFSLFSHSAGLFLHFVPVCHCDAVYSHALQHCLNIIIIFYSCQTHFIFLPATKQTLQRPECSAIFTSMLWFCCRMMPSTMISQ